MDKKFDEGKAEGLQEGEKNMQVKIALNMLKQSLSLQNISSATGLSFDEIKKIQTNMKKPRI